MAILQAISWAGTSPDGRAVIGKLSTMKSLFNPKNADEDYAALNFDLATEEGEWVCVCCWPGQARPGLV